MHPDPGGLFHVADTEGDKVEAQIRLGVAVNGYGVDVLADGVAAVSDAEVDRLVSLGATRIDIGQGEVSWVVMADPDGHEFCVLTPR